MTTADLIGSQLVQEDAAARRFRVHRSSMTSTAVFEREVERVFGRSWLYVGHESEIPQPGDYVRRHVESLGLQPASRVDS